MPRFGNRSESLSSDHALTDKYEYNDYGGTYLVTSWKRTKVAASGRVKGR